MKKFTLIAMMAIMGLVLAACGASLPEMVEVQVTRVVAETVSEVTEEEMLASEEQSALSNGATASLAFDDSNPVAAATPEISVNNYEPRPAERQQTRQRLIIKDGHMTIETETAGEAVTAVANLAASTGGYIISQRVWDQNGYTFATMQIGVPVTEFERAMEQIRKLGTVLQDTASGVDVTDEFVDLNSRLETLEITQERLQTFLSEANKMDDIIKLNNELTRVEEQINTIRGRMNYLADRAAFSTITVQIDPIIPEPTPMPTMTPTPIPDPEPWTVGQTATRGTRQLQNTTRNFVDFFVYTGIVCGPWLLLLGGTLYVGLAIWRRFNGQNLLVKRPTTPAAAISPTEELE